MKKHITNRKIRSFFSQSSSVWNPHTSGWGGCQPSSSKVLPFGKKVRGLKMLTTVPVSNNRESRYRFGWSELNRILNKPKTFPSNILIYGRSHSYRTAFLLSLMDQFMRYNSAPALSSSTKETVVLALKTVVLVLTETTKEIAFDIIADRLIGMSVISGKTLGRYEDSDERGKAQIVLDTLSKKGFSLKVVELPPFSDLQPLVDLISSDTSIKALFLEGDHCVYHEYMDQTKGPAMVQHVARKHGVFFVTTCISPPDRKHAVGENINQDSFWPAQLFDAAINLVIKRPGTGVSFFGNDQHVLKVAVTKIRVPSWNGDEFQLAFPPSGPIMDSEKTLRLNKRI